MIQDFLTYRKSTITDFLAQSIDQRLWRGLPGEEVVFVPLEEPMEVLGYCFIGTALLCAKNLNLKLDTLRA